MNEDVVEEWERAKGNWDKAVPGGLTRPVRDLVSCGDALAREVEELRDDLTVALMLIATARRDGY